MALANLAVFLAEQGRDVLVVDCDPASHAFPRYLGLSARLDSGGGLAALIREWRSSAASGRPRRTDVRTVVTRLARQSDEGGGVDLLPFGQETEGAPADLLTRALQEGWAEDVREDLRSAGYDYVLVDAPGGHWPVAAELAARLSDAVAMCLTLGPAAIDAAVEGAHDIQTRAGRELVTVPILMKVDRTDEKALTAARELAYERFAAVVEPRAGFAEIPYSVGYYYSDSLAVRAEPPGTAGGLREAYENLARTLTGGQVTPLRRVTVVYPPVHRVWAEWITALVESFGLQAEELPVSDLSSRSSVPAGEMMLILLEPGLDGEATSRIGWAADTARGGSRDDPRVLLVDVDGQGPPEELAGLTTLSLGRGDKQTAIDELRRRLRVRAPVPAVTDRRYPRSPDVSNLLARHPRFVGREQTLGRLRDTLGVARDRRRVVLLHGEGGIGKSQSALEYAHRFKGAYDVVWWINADTPETTRTSLGRLAVALELRTAGDAVHAVKSYLGAENAPRWLLVYDNAEVAEDLLSMLPDDDGPGHVIVTSRRGSLPGAAAQEVGALDREESMALLRARSREIPDREATRIVTQLERLPLAVELAAGWLRWQVDLLRRSNISPHKAAETAATLFQADFDRLSGTLTGAPELSGYPLPYRVMLRMTRDALGKGAGGEAAVRLLEVCAFLSSDGVALDLLRSPVMRRSLAAVDARLDDPLMVDVVLRDLDRHGPARVDLGTQEPLRMHRILQHLVLGLMTQEERRKRREDVLEILAAYAPDELVLEEPASRAVLGELGKHLDATRAYTGESPAVRAWVVKQVRHLFLTADRSALLHARDIAEKALVAWGTNSGEHAVSWLQVQLGNVYRALNMHEKAVEYGRAGLLGHRRELVPSHPRVLLAAMSHGANLRAEGNFDEAHAWDQNTLDAMRELYGADHFLTGRAMNNLAGAKAMVGQFHEARDLAQARFERRRELFGPEDRTAWWTAVNIARYLRELGDYPRAHDLLRDTLDHLMATEPVGALGRTADVLRTHLGLAVTERRWGRVAEARRRDEKTLEELQRSFGEEHLLTLACAASLAADRHEEHRHKEAVTLTRETLRIFRRLNRSHPYTSMCEANLSLYLRSANPLDAEALTLGRRSVTELTRRLGGQHPTTLNAMLNLTRTLVIRRDFAEAGTLAEQVELKLARVFHDVQHPLRRMSRRNLDDVLAGEARQDGDRPAPDGRRDIDIEIPEY
ncbi:NTPase [Microtetraspora sp. NBRC 13810]|nr:NTPase [Microtetraspora sp. NBRC 13810]